MSTTKAKLAITDQRMLDVMKFCTANNVEGIQRPADWCRMIGVQPTHISNIQEGERGFSKTQLHNAGEKLGVSMDYLFGFSNQMFRVDKKRSSLDLLKEAMRAVEAEMKEKR